MVFKPKYNTLSTSAKTSGEIRNNVDSDEEPTHPDLVSDSDSDSEDAGDRSTVADRRVDAATARNVHSLQEGLKTTTVQALTQDDMGEDVLAAAMELSDSDESSDGGHVAASRITRPTDNATSSRNKDGIVANLRTDQVPPPPASSREQQTKGKLEKIFPVATTNGEKDTDLSTSSIVQGGT